MPKQLEIEENLIDLLTRNWSKDFDIDTLAKYPQMQKYMSRLREARRLGQDQKRIIAEVLRDFEKERNER